MQPLARYKPNENAIIMKKHILLFIFLLHLATIQGQQQAINYIFKAKAYTSEGKTDQAIDILTNAINEKKILCLYLERAGLNLMKGDYSAAISDYNAANEIVPFSGEYGLSRVYSLKGDPATALYHLGMNLKSDQKKSEKEIMLEPAFKGIERSVEWRKFWKSEWYTASDKSIAEIEYNNSTGTIERSKELLSELRNNHQIIEDVKYAESLVNLAEGKYSEAIKTISELSAKYPGNEKYLRVLANAQENSGNPAGASSAYSALFDSGVADPSLLILRAECYGKTGEHDKAMQDVETYLEIYPEDRTALSLAGKVATLSGDNLKALGYYSENLKLHPNDPQCYIDRGNSYFSSRSWDWAIKDYSMSLDLQPGNSDVWLSKGISLLKTGNVEDACHDFRKAYQLGNKRVVEYISTNCIK
jgi:tetratricopeptide (TPR) repeat protein